LAAKGGKQAVNKAITKRKLKLSQKEKRNRPDGGPSHRGAEPQAKRQRVS